MANMQIKTSKTLANFLQKNTKFKNYKIYQAKLTEKQFDWYVSGNNIFDFENDFDFNTNKFNVIVVDYPFDYYACSKFLTTKDLLKIFDNSDQTAEGFAKAFDNYVEI